MKRVLVTFVLALTTAALGQGASPSQQPPAQPPAAQQPAATDQQANVPASQKVIKDPAEYNAYITALNTTDPPAKGAAMEAFVAQYPQSIVKMDALQQAMGAYQAAGNQQKVEETARKILASDPSYAPAVAIITYMSRSAVTQGQANKLQEMCSSADKGIAALSSFPKPEGMQDAEFQKMRTQMGAIFEGAAGFCNLQSKNFAAAIPHYTKSVQADPTNMQDIYQLGIAELEMNPIDKNGFWHIAKAYSLAPNPEAKKSIAKYGMAKYHNFHGGDDGWDQILASAATETAPGPEIAAIKPKPTPCELAVQAVEQNNPGDLSFSDWEFILQQRDCSPANKDAADKVWQAIQAKEKNGEAKLKIPVKVISAAADSVDAAMTDENQAANKADLHVVLEKPLTKPPAAGTMIDVIGVLTNYAPNPFMFTMEKAEVPSAKPAAKAPAKKGVAKKGVKKKAG